MARIRGARCGVANSESGPDVRSPEVKSFCRDKGSTDDKLFATPRRKESDQEGLGLLLNARQCQQIIK